MNAAVRREIYYVFALHSGKDSKFVPTSALPYMLRMLDCNFTQDEYQKLIESVGQELINFETFYKIVLNTEWGFIDLDEIQRAFNLLKDPKTGKIQKTILFKALTSIKEPIKTEDLEVLFQENSIGPEVSYEQFKLL